MFEKVNIPDCIVIIGLVTALIMAGASVVAYIIGEGLTDAACIEDETEK